MKKTLYTSLTCALALATNIVSEPASAGISDDNFAQNVLTCKMLKDQNEQASLFHKTALNALQKGNEKVLVPVGHFTTYLDANNAVRVTTARMGHITELSHAKGCNASATQKLAFYN